MNLDNFETKKIFCLALAIVAKWFCSRNDNQDGYEDETILDVAADFYKWVNK